MSFSENAILTKSRAIYAKRLTNENYKDLLNCSAISDVSNYLSSKTQYAESFDDVATVKINRMMLENLLRRNLTDRILSLCRFSKILGSRLYEYLIIKNDITAVLGCIRYIKAPNKFDYLITMPTYLENIISVDMVSLAKCDSFDEMLKKLENTQYYDVLKQFEGKETSIINIENALNKYLYSKTNEIAKKNLSKSEYEEVMKLFKISYDLKFISNMYRLKKYFNLSGDKISDYGFSADITALSSKQIEEIIFSKDTESFFDAVDKTPYGKKQTIRKAVKIENWAAQYQYDIMRHTALYSTNPNSVMVCCVYLAENEIKNIIHIIEGIKYNIPSSEIAKLLIGYES